MKLSKREQQLIEECKNADDAELRALIAKLAEELETQPDQRLAKAIDRLAEAIENQPRPLVIPAPYPVPTYPHPIWYEYKPPTIWSTSESLQVRYLTSGNTIISGNAQ